MQPTSTNSDYFNLVWIEESIKWNIIVEFIESSLI